MDNTWTHRKVNNAGDDVITYVRTYPFRSAGQDTLIYYYADIKESTLNDSIKGFILYKGYGGFPYCR